MRREDQSIASGAMDHPADDRDVEILHRRVNAVEPPVETFPLAFFLRGSPQVERAPCRFQVSAFSALISAVAAMTSANARNNCR